MEHDVVGHVADARAKGGERECDRAADGAEVLLAGSMHVRLVGPRDDQHLVGGAAPEGAEHQHVVVGVNDPLLGVELGFDHGAEQAVALEPCEAGELVRRLTGDERHRQQLAVRVLD